MKIQLGAVWHFSLAVRDPQKHSQFWTKNFALKEWFRSDEAVCADERCDDHRVLQGHATSGYDRPFVV